MCSTLEILSTDVSSNSYLNTWKEKINRRIQENEYGIGSPEMETVVKFALEFLQDYHDDQIDGHRSSSNADPTDMDMEVFSDIVITLLHERQIVDSFEQLPGLKRKVLHELKKQFYASSEADERSEQPTKNQ